MYSKKSLKKYGTYRIKYLKKNKEKLKQKAKEWRLNNKTKFNEIQKRWRLKNKDKINSYHKKYLLKHKKKYSSKYFKKRILLHSKLSSIINSFKDKNISMDLNYKPTDLKNHIEKQFNPNMSWNNYGTYWEIDHIIPLNTAQSVEDVCKLFELNNLRPLEVIKNRQRHFLEK